MSSFDIDSMIAESSEMQSVGNDVPPTMTVGSLILATRTFGITYTPATIELQDLLSNLSTRSLTGEEFLRLIRFVLQHIRKFGKGNNAGKSLQEELNDEQIDIVHREMMKIIDPTDLTTIAKYPYGPHSFAKQYTAMEGFTSASFVFLAVVYSFAILVRENVWNMEIETPILPTIEALDEGYSVNEKKQVFFPACKALLKNWFSVGIHSKNHLFDSIDLIFRTLPGTFDDEKLLSGKGKSKGKGRGVKKNCLKKGGDESGMMKEMVHYFRTELSDRPYIPRSKKTPKKQRLMAQEDSDSDSEDNDDREEDEEFLDEFTIFNNLVVDSPDTSSGQGGGSGYDQNTTALGKRSCEEIAVVNLPQGLAFGYPIVNPSALTMYHFVAPIPMPNPEEYSNYAPPQPSHDEAVYRLQILPDGRQVVTAVEVNNEENEEDDSIRPNCLQVACHVMIDSIVEGESLTEDTVQGLESYYDFVTTSEYELPPDAIRYAK